MSVPVQVGPDPALDALWEMPLVHRVFRQGLADVTRWVRTVAPDEKDRADAIGHRLIALLDGLGALLRWTDEDVLPLLRLRGPMDTDAGLLLHRTDLEESVVVVRGMLATWAGDLVRPEALLAALTDCRRALEDYLSGVERDLIPMVAARVTAVEWQTLAREVSRRLPADSWFGALGQVLRAGTPEQAALRLEQLPPVLRVLWYVSGRRRFDRSLARLEGR